MIESICIFSTRHITIHPVVDTDAKIVSPRTLFSRMDFLFRLTQIYCFSHEARLRISHHKWLEMDARKRRPSPFSSVHHPAYTSGCSEIHVRVFYFGTPECVCSVLFIFISRNDITKRSRKKVSHTKRLPPRELLSFLTESGLGMGRSK